MDVKRGERSDGNPNSFLIMILWALHVAFSKPLVAVYHVKPVRSCEGVPLYRYLPQSLKELSVCLKLKINLGS